MCSQTIWTVEPWASVPLSMLFSKHAIAGNTNFYVFFSGMRSQFIHLLYLLRGQQNFWTLARTSYKLSCYLEQVQKSHSRFGCCDFWATNLGEEFSTLLTISLQISVSQGTWCCLLEYFGNDFSQVFCWWSKLPLHVLRNSIAQHSVEQHDASFFSDFTLVLLQQGNLKDF